MTSAHGDSSGSSSDSLYDPHSVGSAVPLTSRLAHQIPKPNDWQAFQRACVILFRAELNDPNAQEYGRGGQHQSGIDILGRRNASSDHFVGVQCRHVKKPLKQPKILSDCQAALTLKADLREIIFATTAPADTHATDAAIAVERILQEDGRKISITIYGWDQLQLLIATHPAAYNAFFPFAVSTSAPQPAATPTVSAGDIAAQVVAQLREMGLASPPREVGAANLANEDPALHARIDTFRDLFTTQQQTLSAERGLLALLENENLDDKPWARFRIETNLASIAIDLGRESEGAARLETAYSLRPDDSKAIANLALARTIQGRFAEAMELAHKALESHPRADHAVAYLLQAAARSDWVGDPESLIPLDLIGTAQADLGLAEFLRRRDVPKWAERSRELADKHSDMSEFKRVRAIAILSLSLESGASVLGGQGLVTFEELSSAADDMKAAAEHCLNVGFADQHDLAAYLNNAALLLRLANRHPECESLLLRGMQKVQNEPQLRRVLALAQAHQGRQAEARATLRGDEDFENRLLDAELASAKEPAKALEQVLAIDPTALNPRLASLRWSLAGEIALKMGNQERVSEAIAGLHAVDPQGINAKLLQIRWDRKAGLDEKVVHDRLRAISATLPAGTDMTTRYLLAGELRDQGLPEEAASLLESYVDIAQRSPATILYLQSLAAARRDDAFREAMSAAGQAVQEDAEILWTAASHAWNIGDLAGAYGWIGKLLEQNQENAQARLLKVEILVRQNQTAELLTELDKPVESLQFSRLSDRLRIAILLGSFGYLDRAAASAYRLFLENRDKPQAWMTLSALVLEEGWSGAHNPQLWDTPAVAPNVAVDLRYDDGEELFLVVEPDTDLRRLDDESWEPHHLLVQALSGLTTGSRFEYPASRQGTIVQLRHKYVARLHYVLEHYEVRFPQIEGVRRVPVDVERPDGLDEFIAQLKARHDWVEQEQERYLKGPWPLGVLAFRVGLDTIEVAGGLASQGLQLKVAKGDGAEREAAQIGIRENQRSGCVLDLLSFWTAWRLQSLESIETICGPVHLPQNAVDRLRTRRDKIEFSTKNGLRSVAYEKGKLAATEVAPAVVLGWLEDTDRAIAWIEANVTVSPVIAGNELPTALREHLRVGQSDVFDSLVLAMHRDLLLVSDDLPTRDFGRIFRFAKSTWLHQVFVRALNLKLIDVQTFIRSTANLVDAGHNYIGVTGPALARAARLDAESGEAPGYLFKTLSKVIGGPTADAHSHVVAVLDCLRDLWTDPSPFAFRKPVTGLLLWRLIQARQSDYGAMLRAIMSDMKDQPEFIEYLHMWVRGHFLPATTLRQ